MRGRWSRTASIAAAVVGAWALVAGSVPAQAVGPPPLATSPAMLVGASSPDWDWFDASVGPAEIYRVFDDGGFSYPTWQDTAAHQRHPNATAFDYSFHVLPQRLTNPADPVNDQIRGFLATTPKNLIVTNNHEPDDPKGTFTPGQFRAGIVALAAMVRAQNARDGGTRQTSVILMGVTFTGAWSTTADDWWPTDARDGGRADIIEGDLYQFPHATNTPGVPAGYTDGVKWRSSRRLISPLRDFARAHNTPWAIAELGMLEDVNDPNHRANELAAAVAFARDNGAQHISYHDRKGPRSDWRLRWSNPVGSTSNRSAAAMMWRSLMSPGSQGPGPSTREWVQNPRLDGGSTAGWAASGPATTLSAELRSNNWMLAIANQTPQRGDVVACSAAPYWVGSTTAGVTYTAGVQVTPSVSGTPARLFLREVTAGGDRVGFVSSPTVILTSTTAPTTLPKLSLTAARSGSSIRMCVVGSTVSQGQTLFADNLSLTSPG